MSDLTELLERVKAATGREIALERETMCAVGGWSRLTPSQHHRHHKHPMFVDTLEGDATHEGRSLYRDVPRIMESIDAALALTERVLPGWEWQVRKSGYVELHHPTHHLKDEVGTAKTPPIAILAALLSALIAQGASS